MRGKFLFGSFLFCDITSIICLDAYYSGPTNPDPDSKRFRSSAVIIIKIFPIKTAGEVIKHISVGRNGYFKIDDANLTYLIY